MAVAFPWDFRFSQPHGQGFGAVAQVADSMEN